MGNSRAWVPLAYGFRPFFLAAGWYAVLGTGAWLWLYGAGVSPLPHLPSLYWHGHEMLFGFITAAIAGFLLTAVPSWTSSRGFAGAPLALLVSLWLLGRVMFAAAGAIQWPAIALAELAFLPALATLVAPPLLRARNRNTPLLLVLLVLWACDAAFMVGWVRVDVPLAKAALLTALNVVLLLLTVIGGRIVPSFTANALHREGREVAMPRRRWLDRLAIAAMAAVILIDLLRPNGTPAGVVAAFAAAVQLLRLGGWHGHLTLRQPIVWVLHAAYAWLPIGLMLKACFLLGSFDWAAFWLHALGAGAAGTMILAVMARASLGHTGRELVAPRSVAWAFGVLTASVLVRVLGTALLPLDYRAVILLAGALWIGAFGLFVLVYTPILVGPRADGKPG